MSPKRSTNILLGLLSAVILFHILIIVKVVPYDIAWGGRLRSDQEMYVFETLSILLNLFLVMILMMKAGYSRPRFEDTTLNKILWFFIILFLLNSIGNLFAETGLEKTFAVVTLLFAILLWGVLKPK